MPRTVQPQSPAYTDDERHAVIDFILALRKSQIQDLLRQAELARSGTKPTLRERLEDALDDGRLTLEQMVHFLDGVAPWGKQHVFLYAGPTRDVQRWRDPSYVLRQLKRNRVDGLFNRRLPLVLPERLTLSSIEHSDSKLRITAVQKRAYSERAPEHDEERESISGAPISLRAYVHHISRTIVAFEWNLRANTAMLQITQLHKDTLYEEVAEEFKRLVGKWLNIDEVLQLVDIRKAIRKLHELEADGKPEARSHGIQYRTLRGRRLSAQSPSPQDSVLGEADIDRAMDTVGKHGVGHLGNIYWLPNGDSDPTTNPLSKEVHVYIVGDKRRVNFPTPNSEEAVRYVLTRVRELS